MVFETIIIREKISPNLRLVNSTSIAIDSSILVYGGYNTRKQASPDLKIMNIQGKSFTFLLFFEKVNLFY